MFTMVLAVAMSLFWFCIFYTCLRMKCLDNAVPAQVGGGAA